MAEAEQPTIKKLYYDVVTKYKLPTINNRVLQMKMKDLEAEVGYEFASIYLKALLKYDWDKLEGEFKPTITRALDVYGKRVKILKFLREHIPAPTSQPDYDQMEAARKADLEQWGITDGD